MNNYFIYDDFVTGKNFIGRKADCAALAGLLAQGRDVCIYEPPRAGKTSLIRQTLNNMKAAGASFSVKGLSLLDIRDVRTFLSKYALAAVAGSDFDLGGMGLGGVLDSGRRDGGLETPRLCGTGGAWLTGELAGDADIVAGGLGGGRGMASGLGGAEHGGRGMVTGFVSAGREGLGRVGGYAGIVTDIDAEDGKDAGRAVDAQPGIDMDAVLGIPYRVAAREGRRLYFILDEFQDIMLTEDGDNLIKALNRVMQAQAEPLCTFIFTGSMFNAMRRIFDVRKYFYRRVTRVPLSMVETKAITEHIAAGLLSEGKVVDKEALEGYCAIFRNDLCYLNHFASMCDSLSKGYITDRTLSDALRMMVAIHEPRFKAMMCDMTTYQIWLLAAVLDGVRKFSSAGVIRKYHFNSSANVKRLKGALMKKEVVAFGDDDDEALILDPLFEYWVRTRYFGQAPAAI